MAEIAVGLRYQSGWLTLSLRAEESELSVRGTTLAPIVADLVVGLQDIADGRRAVSVRWEGEPGGVFLDFAQGEAGWNSGRCSPAVHRVDEDALDRLGHDSPVRGAVLFSATTSTATLLATFIKSIASVRPDLDAVTRRPRRPFPDGAFAKLLASTAAHWDRRADTASTGPWLRTAGWRAPAGSPAQR